MNIKITNQSNLSIHQQIVEGVENMILSQELKSGEYLQSVRETAVKLKVNPNTVSKAFQELQRMGLLISIRGKGLQVAALKDSVMQKRKERLIKKAIEDLFVKANQLKIDQKNLLKQLKEML